MARISISNKVLVIAPHRRASLNLGIGPATLEAKLRAPTGRDQTGPAGGSVPAV